MSDVKVYIVNHSKHDVPQYATEHSAGLDLRANIDADIILKPLQRILVSTGIFIELPQGYEAQIRPRSGLALKYGLTVLNSPGTIDADFRGEICVILINLSNIPFIIASGTRIAQLVFAKCEKAALVEVKEINDTERGEGGFGHTGNK